MKLYLQKPRKPRPSATALRALFVVPVFPAAIVAAALAAILAVPAPVHADILIASAAAAFDEFGHSVSLSADSVLVGAFRNDDKGTDSGAAYYYKGLSGEGESGTVTQDVKLLASDGSAGAYFGALVSLSGDSALVGTDTGRAAYYYKELNGKSDPVVYQDVKLLCTDVNYENLSPMNNIYFGILVSLSGDSALVGALGDSDVGDGIGSAYYYKELNKKSGTVTQDVKLRASDGTAGNFFSESVSLSGDSALVGADAARNNGISSGSAYYYKGLNGKSDTVTEDVKLLPSESMAYGRFGYSVSLSGDSALVGAGSADNMPGSGAAYYYKGLDGKSGTVTEDVKLLPSDRAVGDGFGGEGGESVSLSGNSALVGAGYGNNKGSRSGAAYYYKGLDGKSGTVTEDVKLLPSDSSAALEYFGYSVSLSGDRFVIGAYWAYMGVEEGTAAVRTGKAYAGDIRAFTTLDATGGAALATGGLSFVSQGDWIIGETTRGNQVTLSKVWSSNQDNPDGDWFNDTADVTADGKAVYIGQKAGANNNRLIVEGTLVANAVYVGASTEAEGSGNINTGNALRFTTDALSTLDVGTIWLGAGNFIEFEGADYGIDDVLTLLSGTTVQVWDGEGWTALASDNADTLILKTGVVDGEYSQFSPLAVPAPVPEPSAWAAIAGIGLLAWAVLRRGYTDRP
ncbi:MAG: FG-GAP repeat protein [Opitutaceae bacterium]|jgi:hypothetical protein|nr:FG-GAP repeat protein [Opitutaceae bacterium]